MGLFRILLLVAAVCILAPLAAVVATLLFAGRMAATLWQTARVLVSEPQLMPASTRLTATDLVSSDPVVYFVHGTFASGAPWTAADAAIGTAIAGALRADGLEPVFQRIEWSGANTVAARCDAIADLEACLDRIFAINPHRRVLLIGHSHGGSVAIKAAERFARCDGLAVITLATPFIIAQVRRDAAALGGMMRLLLCACLAVSCGVGAALTPFPWLLVPAAAALASMVFAVRAVLPATSRADEATEALLRTVPDLGAVAALIPRTLIVSRSGDEADGVLKLASFVNGWLAQALRESALTSEVSRLLAEARGAAVARDQAAAGGGRAMLPTMRESLALVGYVQRMRSLGPEVAGVLAAMTLLQLLRVAVGTTSGLLATTAVVTSSETPPGQWQHVQTLASSHPSATVMSHSQIYDDPYLCELVATWLQRRWSVQRTAVAGHPTA